MSGAEVEVQENQTLYEVITEIAGFEKDEDTTADEFKMNLVRHFDEQYPGEEEFNELPENVQNWLNEAASVAKKNRGSTKQKSLPALDGLDLPPEPKKRGRKAKDPSEKKVRSAKAPKEKKERGPSRYLRTMQVMLANPELNASEMAKKAGIAEASAGYCYDAWKAAKVAFEEAGYTKS